MMLELNLRVKRAISNANYLTFCGQEAANIEGELYSRWEALADWVHGFVNGLDRTNEFRQAIAGIKRSRQIEQNEMECGNDGFFDYPMLCEMLNYRDGLTKREKKLFYRLAEEMGSPLDPHSLNDALRSYHEAMEELQLRYHSADQSS